MYIGLSVFVLYAFILFRFRLARLPLLIPPLDIDFIIDIRRNIPPLHRVHTRCPAPRDHSVYFLVFLDTGSYCIRRCAVCCRQYL